MPPNSHNHNHNHNQDQSQSQNIRENRKFAVLYSQFRDLFERGIAKIGHFDEPIFLQQRKLIAQQQPLLCSPMSLCCRNLNFKLGPKLPAELLACVFIVVVAVSFVLFPVVSLTVAASNVLAPIASFELPTTTTTSTLAVNYFQDIVTSKELLSNYLHAYNPQHPDETQALQGLASLVDKSSSSSSSLSSAQEEAEVAAAAATLSVASSGDLDEKLTASAAAAELVTKLELEMENGRPKLTPSTNQLQRQHPHKSHERRHRRHHNKPTTELNEPNTAIETTTTLSHKSDHLRHKDDDNKSFGATFTPKATLHQQQTPLTTIKSYKVSHHNKQASSSQRLATKFELNYHRLNELGADELHHRRKVRRECLRRVAKQCNSTSTSTGSYYKSESRRRHKRRLGTPATSLLAETTHGHDPCKEDWRYKCSLARVVCKSGKTSHNERQEDGSNEASLSNKSSELTLTANSTSSCTTVGDDQQTNRKFVARSSPATTTKTIIDNEHQTQKVRPDADTNNAILMHFHNELAKTIHNSKHYKQLNSQLCDFAALKRMKTKLLANFSHNVPAMFAYFDANNDTHIDARELWPRHDLLSSSLLSPRSSSSTGASTNHDNDNENDKNNYNYNQEEQELDWAFEPAFSGEYEPCSLSHLLLYDLQHHHELKFTPETFAIAFKDLVSQQTAANIPTIASSGRNSRSSLLKNLSHKNPTNKLVARQAETDEHPKVMEFDETHVVGLGQSVSFGSCFFGNFGPNLRSQINVTQSEFALLLTEDDQNQDDPELGVNMTRTTAHATAAVQCSWLRRGAALSSVDDLHVQLSPLKSSIQIVHEQRNEFVRTTDVYDSVVNISYAQLYLSGPYDCSCVLLIVRNEQKLEIPFQQRRLLVRRDVTLQVTAPPRVSLKSNFQWSAPNSKTIFECQYDWIDTRTPKTKSYKNCSSNIYHNINERANESQQQNSNQFELKVEWLKNNELIASSTDIKTPVTQNNTLLVDTSFVVEEEIKDDTNKNKADFAVPKIQSLSMAASKLTIDAVQPTDTGLYTCRVSSKPVNTQQLHGCGFNLRNNSTSNRIHYQSAEDKATLLVQEEPVSSLPNENLYEHLWVFHETGISIYRVTRDESEQLQLVSAISGQSFVKPQVEGNWNQMTLCGGLNGKKSVVCEWTDNALHVKPNFEHLGLNLTESKYESSSEVESRIVSRVFTRRSHQSSYVYVGQPNLNRVLIFDANEFELVAIVNTEPAPKKLYLLKPSKVHLSKWVKRRLSPATNAKIHSMIGKVSFDKNHQNSNSRKNLVATLNYSQLKQLYLPLVQMDIWVLCYGQPIVLASNPDIRNENKLDLQNKSGTFSQSSFNSIWSWPWSKHFPTKTVNSPPATSAFHNSKEQQLRNRKAVYVIQSTFFAKRNRKSTYGRKNLLTNFLEDSNKDDMALDNNGLEQTSQLQEQMYIPKKERMFSPEMNFKRSAVITSHHIISGNCCGIERQFDLVHDLFVPNRPRAVEDNLNYRVHDAFVAHYDDQRLFRVSADDYTYYEAINLNQKNCDALDLITTAQGLLILQCRSPVTHNLIGQLVLDELTGSTIEFNANIKAQYSYLSPDHHYLISIFTNTSVSKQLENKSLDSVIIVQQVTTLGLELKYEIKTALEILQCAFVWKDGYYAAILLSLDDKDNLTEILNLRLIDGRLELVARISGIDPVRLHQSYPSGKETLLVSSKSNLAAVTVNKGTFLVDLEDNRLRGQVTSALQTPTLVWT